MSGFRRAVRGKVGPSGLPVFAALGLCLAVALTLAACAGTTASTAPTATPRATPRPTPQVRFTADWSQGLSGWQATPGWTVKDGAVESGTANGLSLTIPYRPPAGTYAVELDVQVLNVPHNGGGFVLDVAQAAPIDGYQAGVGGMVVPGPRPFGLHPTIFTIIHPTDDQASLNNNFGVTDFDPGDNVRTYRFLVDDSLLSLSVDGRTYVEAESTQDGPLATGPLTIQVNGVQLRISGARVIA